MVRLRRRHALVFDLRNLWTVLRDLLSRMSKQEGVSAQLQAQLEAKDAQIATLSEQLKDTRQG